MRLTKLLIGLALLAPATAAADIPVPENDSFYAVPKGLKHVANGTVLDSRKVDATSFGIPLPAQAWQVKYRTLDVHRRATATVTTVLVPTQAWPGTGKRPLVSYQTAEDGVSGKCAPSYVLRNGLASGTNNTAPESMVIGQALQRGIAVAVPDYEGPASEFLAARGEGRMVLDGIRAARRFKDAGLRGAPVGIWGYSGGAFATSIAGQLQPKYAPRVKLAAIVLGGVPANVKDTIMSFDNLGLGGIIAMGFSSVSRAYPKMHLLDYLNEEGKAAVAAGSRDCIIEAGGRSFGRRLSDFESVPHAIDTPEITSFLQRISPLGVPGTPAAPVYDYHAVLDELAKIGPDRELVAKYCAAGVKVQHYEEQLGEHLSLVGSGAPAAIDYLADRFNGVPAPSTC
ncbi:MAG: hypothetical protein QOF76_307 [Solirubrobacteraceae bacterium]|jgi:hypothetical protein|nr:hypothetical protein [Solirubrobacteraceae bacterium]